MNLSESYTAMRLIITTGNETNMFAKNVENTSGVNSTRIWSRSMANGGILIAQVEHG